MNKTIGAGTKTRAFGVPGSLVGGTASHDERKLTLNLERSQDVQTWDLIDSVSALWQGLLTNEERRQEFLRDPPAVLRQFGIDESLVSGTDKDSCVFQAICDPAVRKALEAGDISTFLTHLSARGIGRSLSESVLVERLVEVFVNNHEQYQQWFAPMMVGATNATDAIGKIAAYRDPTRRNPSAVFVATNVVVAVNVVTITDTVSTVQVTVDGGPGHPTSITQFQALKMGDALCPGLLDDVVDMNRVAAILGYPGFQRAIVDKAVRIQAEAIVTAAEKAGVAHFAHLNKTDIADHLVPWTALRHEAPPQVAN